MMCESWLVALLGSVSTSLIWIDFELSVPAGQIPRPIVGACCIPFNRTFPEVAVTASTPVIPAASGHAI